MTLIILDPNLDRETGHHIEWDMRIARAAIERHESAVIYGHKKCELRELDGVTIVPWFSHSCYEKRFGDPITGAFDEFRFFNDHLAGELAQLPRELFRTADAVLVPTLNENHLLGYVAWMRSFDPVRAPLFIVHLMFPSGIDFSTEGEILRINELQALFYKLAFREAAKPGPKIHFFGGGLQLAQEFSALQDTRIEAHPIPNCPLPGPTKPAGTRPACLLFAGDAKADKGFILVPDLLTRLSQAHPAWDFLIHANPTSAWGAALEAYHETVALAPRYPNVRLSGGRLTRDEYLALIESASAMISTYDPAVYARKSSGVLWEAVSLGVPVLVPDKTWLEREASAWGAGYVTYPSSEYGIGVICREFRTLAENLDQLALLSAKAAARYHASNGEAALMDQLGRLWASRMAAASLSMLPQAQILPLEEIATQGWSYTERLGGQPVRWTAKEFEIEFSWPHNSAWCLQVAVSNYIGHEQLLRLQAFSADQALAVDTGLNAAGPGGHFTVTGLGLGRESPQVRIHFILPWAYRPADETRDLGLLIGGLKLGPANTSADGNAVRTIEIRSPLTLSADGGSFLLERVISGLALLDPRHDVAVRFDVRTTGGPLLARAVRLAVNGVPVTLDVQYQHEDLWCVNGECSSSVTGLHGFRVEWDLYLEIDGGVPIWISGLAFGNGPALPVPQRLPGEFVPDLPESVGPASALPELVHDSVPAVPIVGVSRPEAEDVWLDEFYTDDGYRHIDITILALSSAGEHWPRLKLKVCHLAQRDYIEFRRMPGWPEMFEDWPSMETDEFGGVLRIGEGLSQTIPSVFAPRDRLMLRALAAVLPEMVGAALRRARHGADDTLLWVSGAVSISEFLTVFAGDVPAFETARSFLEDNRHA